jgi:hypothetical protein
MKNQPDNFIPLFKEKEAKHFYFSNNKWIKCDENKIYFLWRDWVVSMNTSRYMDDKGFLVFGYSTIEIPITICYKFSEGIDVLKEKLIIGKEYLFSDMLQEEKGFKVKWQKGILDKIEKHPYSANCFVSKGQCFLYAKELDS